MSASLVKRMNAMNMGQKSQVSMTGSNRLKRAIVAKRSSDPGRGSVSAADREAGERVSLSTTSPPPPPPPSVAAPSAMPSAAPKGGIYECC